MEADISLLFISIFLLNPYFYEQQIQKLYRGLPGMFGRMPKLSNGNGW